MTRAVAAPSTARPPRRRHIAIPYLVTSFVFFLAGGAMAHQERQVEADEREPEVDLAQHWLGNEGIPRRYADYLPTDGFTTLNIISSIGAFVLGASTLPFIWNVFKSYRYGRVVTVDDPWGFGNSLEWATSCPPPRHNFTELPRIRSERPPFELHQPQVRRPTSAAVLALRGRRARGRPRDPPGRRPEAPLNRATGVRPDR